MDMFSNGDTVIGFVWNPTSFDYRFRTKGFLFKNNKYESTLGYIVKYKNNMTPVYLRGLISYRLLLIEKNKNIS